jgi:hypothetical protein
MSALRRRFPVRLSAGKARRRMLRVEGLEDRTVPSFTVAPNFPVGPGGGQNSKPVSIATGDFNGDGHLDVVTANSDATFISILMGNGDGSFAASNDMSIGQSPVFVRAADLNGDGILDLVTANKTNNSVSVLLGNGDGTFQSAINLSTGANSGPVAIDVGDLNGDGKPDLAVADGGGSTISIFLGDGAGNFPSGSTVTAGTNSTSVAIGDFNGDGHPDLASVSGGFGHLDVNLNNGNGTFGAAVNYATGFVANGVTVGDFNGDGKADLAVACVFPSGDGVSVLLGNGDGTFQPFVSYSAGNQTPGYITTADLNGDGKTDLVTANYASTGAFANNSISLLPGNGDGTFGTARVYYGGMAPAAVAVGDFNGDGKQDVVSANDGGSVGTVAYFQGNGDGTVVASEGLPITVRNAASWNGIESGDFTGDGIPDLALLTWNVNYNGITIAPGLGNGRFGPGIQTAPLDGALTEATGDFNGDGKPDLVVADYAGIQVLLGNGDGTFNVLPAVAGGSGPQWIAVADFNNDGKPDLAVADTSGPDGVSILLGNGDGTFQTATGVNTGAGENYVSAADLNGDGIPDLAVVGGSGGAILLNNGNGTFGAAATFNPGSATGGLSLGDLNGDGFPDLVVPSFIPPGGGGSAILVSLNDGSGHFGGFTQYATDSFGSNPCGSTILDVDGDGIPDIVVVNDFSDTISVFSGNGDGSFQPQQTAVVGDRPTWVTTGDFNGDGRTDLAVVNSNSGSVTIVMRPAPATQLQVTGSRPSITAGDSVGVTVTARDALGNADPDFRGTVTFGSDDGQADLPTDNPYTFTAADAGSHTFDFTLRTAGAMHVNVNGPFGTVSTPVDVTPQAADHLKFVIPSMATAGGPLDVTVEALDQYGNIDTNYAGTVSFASTDTGALASVPGDYTFAPVDAGQHMFSAAVTLVTAGSRSVSVSANGLTGDGSSVSVSPAAASRLTLSIPNAATAGTPVNVGLTAYDNYNNVATGFAGTVHLDSSDGASLGLGDYMFTPANLGTKTVPFTFITAGGQSISVSSSGLTGDQKSGITISPAVASTLEFVDEPVSTFRNFALPELITVQVKDAYGNPVAKSVPVTLSLQGNPGGATLKGITTVLSDTTGKATFAGLKLTKSAAGYTLIANSSVGTSAPSDAFTVYAVTRFKVVASTKKATAGGLFSVTVTALDAKGQPDPTYRGTVHFTSTDGPLAQIPGDYTFTAGDGGTHTFQNIFLTKAGGRKLKVADTNSTRMKASAAVSVIAGSAAKFLVSGFPASGRSGRASSFTVTAQDAYGNRATSYLGTVTFASGGKSATLPTSYTFIKSNGGRRSFKATFPTAGTGLSLTVTDQNDPTITGTETGITIV